MNNREEKIRHEIRKKDLEIIFANCPDYLFDNGLEIGAGDGYQSFFLKKYIKNYTCTEINQKNFTSNTGTNVAYQVMDVQEITARFNSGTMDIVFSSNLLEHLPDIDATLQDIKKILKEDGIMVHVMPNRFWKILQVIFWIPYNLAGIFGGSKYGVWESREYLKSNICRGKKRSPWFLFLRNIYRTFVVPVHGVKKNHVLEFISFGKEYWLRIFKRNDLDVKVIPLQLHTPYRFGLRNKVRIFFSRYGFCSSYAYIAGRKLEDNPYVKLLLG